MCFEQAAYLKKEDQFRFINRKIERVAETFG